MTAHLLSIGDYATSHTEKSVFIIGGRSVVQEKGPGEATAIIARFKDNAWKNVGSLKQARNRHRAITVNGITIIVGGMPNNWIEKRFSGYS